VFSDPSGKAGLTAQGLDAVADLPGVELVVGIGHATDVYNTALGDAGNPVPSRAIYTALPPVLNLTSGRAPAVGEAIAGQTAIRELGMVDGVGGVTGKAFRGPVVGTFAIPDPFTDLNRSVLVATPAGPDEHLRSVYVVASATDNVALLLDAVPALLYLSDPVQLRVDSPEILADLQLVVAGELGENSRRLMLVALAAGLTFLTVTLYGATYARRRDFGRRRALGASRSTIVVLVLAHTAVAATAGALTGTGAGLLVVHLLQGNLPAWSFTFGVPTLAILTALLASIPPAVAAALRDPVRILRVP
jgi:putative ABC transport system permease protein